MSKSPVLVSAEPTQFSEIEAGRIRAQLERLLASPQFRGSRRCQLLLEYVTGHTLTGDTSPFKERTLGCAVFGREPNYDTNQDPIVRATAAEIRKKLAQYYQESAHTEEIRISLLAGSYIPAFHFPEVAAPPPPPVQIPQPPPPAKNRRRWIIVAGTACLIACAAVGYRFMQRSALDLFWGRMLGSSGILFCVGQPPVFNFRSDAKQFDLWERILKSPDAWPASSAPISPRDLVPMPGRYFATGDAISLVHLASFFEKHKTQYFIRNSNLVRFEDLREHPAILIGVFDNDWTLRFQAPLRFSFNRRFTPSGGATEFVRDRKHPDQMQWELTDPWPEWNVSRDYSIITRLLDPSTDRMLVGVAGITQYGTAAAGEFLTNPDYFSQAESRLPHDWPKKNLQIVLQVPVVHGASGRPEVLAVEVW